MTRGQTTPGEIDTKMHSQELTRKAFSLSLSFAAIFTLVLFGLSFVQISVADVYYVWHVNEYNIVSTKWQIFFYVSYVAFLCLAASFFSRRADRYAVLGGIRTVDHAFAAFLCILLMLCQFHPWFVSGLGCVVLLVYFLAAMTRMRMPRLAKRGFTLAVSALAALFFVVQYAMPVYFPLFVSDRVFLSNLELHYAMSVLPGFEFGSGMQEALIGKQYYGFSMSLLVAAATKLLGFIESGMTRLVVAVKLLQIVALGLVLCNLYLLNRRNFLLLCVATLAMVAALTTVGIPVYFPNQAGLRYIPLLLGLLFLTWQRRAATQRLWPFSLAGGLLVAANPETGLAFLAGCTIFLGARRLNERGSWPGALAVMFANGLLSFGIFLTVYQLLTFFLIQNVQPDFFSNIRTFSQGLGGSVSRPHVLATLVFFVGAYTVLRAFLKASRRLMTPTDAYQAAVGGIMLTWLLYYVAREDEWNLWFQSILLVACIAPRLGRPFRLLGATRSRPALFMSALLVFVLTAASVTAYMYDRAYQAHVTFFSSMPKMFTDLSTHEPFYFFNPEDKAAYDAKMGFLDNIKDKSEYLVFSNYPVSVRMRGFNTDMPWYDLFGEINSVAKFSNLVYWMTEHGHKYLIMDDASSGLTANTPNHFAHYDSFLTAMPLYKEVKRESGWVVYARTGS